VFLVVCLLQREAKLASKVSSLELTVKRFTCTRILPNASHNVSCELSIKKMTNTGEVLLCVRDYREAAGAPSVTGALSPRAPLAAGEMETEYMQDISTVRCRAVDEGDVKALVDAGAHETDLLLSQSLGTDPAALSPSALVSAPAGGAGHGLPHTVLLGYRPRFLLCFTADSHRCMVFETEAAQWRDHICATLQQFVRMHREQHMDELGRFFGDQTAASAPATLP
jgi:hypothetical protein